jgi:hypothetical protein
MGYWVGHSPRHVVQRPNRTHFIMPRTVRRALPPGISRIDQDTTRTHGFFVRVGYRKTVKGWRPKASAFFGDASHGGKSGALRAAERWLRQTKRAQPKGRGRAA